MIAQYAYELDRVQEATSGRSDNGISEILAIDRDRLLVLERSGSEVSPGRFNYHCRLYVVDTRSAQDIASIRSLSKERARPVPKQLLVALDSLAGVRPANFEAMAWGPSTTGRSETLVLMADDNFDPRESGQIVVLEIRPGLTPQR